MIGFSWLSISSYFWVEKKEDGKGMKQLAMVKCQENCLLVNRYFPGFKL